MRILFAGTPPMAVPSLEKLAHQTDVIAVLTAPDQPAGRGRSPCPSAVKEAGLALHIPVLTPSTLDEASRADVRSLAPDLLVVVAYGKIFRRSFLDIFPRGGINLHPSLLPRFRGPSPITAAILAGDDETGVTVQELAMRFDTGDILGQVRYPLDGNETTGSLTGALAEIGAELLLTVVGRIASGQPLEPTPQVEADATYCQLVRKEDGILDWRDPAVLVERKVRAYDPWPRARTTLRGDSLLLLKTRVHPDTLGDAAHRPVPGEVLAADEENGILVQTGEGILRIERLQMQFRKPLDWRPFLHGHPDLAGAHLGA
ncbi:MAG TPA: methionyl-tRNA formyltransferase [Spirochaetia bacterium]|nr:methionyl-tRNA formyltransferase [Spirochaetia bacterium]